MLHKTRGIVFRTTNYSENSVIVQVFTEKFGMQSYLVGGAKKPKARIRMNMLQPLHLLDMIVYHKPAGNSGGRPPIEKQAQEKSNPLHPSWDTVGSPVCRPPGVLDVGSNRGRVVGPAEPASSTPGGRADQEQPTLWRMASDFARTARRRPCAGALANGFEFSCKTKSGARLAPMRLRPKDSVGGRIEITFL